MKDPAHHRRVLCSTTRVRRLTAWLGLVLWGVLAQSDLQGGGSGLNTLVVVNQASSNSCELGNYFTEHRNVPPENVLRINWQGGNISWTSNDFATVLLTPLLDLLAERQLTNQADYVVLSMDFPFRTISGSDINSTTTALFYGLKSGGIAVDNSYAGSEAVFDEATPATAPGFSFITTMITGDSLVQAKQLVNQGVVSDSSFPNSPVILAKSSDVARNLRHTLFDNTILNCRVLGFSCTVRTNTDAVWWPARCLGYQTGLAQFNVNTNLLVPGSIADSMTSFGGVIFGPNTQTNLLAFIEAGAAGAYGTVAEPYTDIEKFPNPQVYFYQVRGFSLAESYYQSVNTPYLGLMVGEPLAAPFAKTGSGMWSTNLTGSVISNTATLSVQFTAADPSHPLQQVDLFIDGKYFDTVTNIPPSPGNVLTAGLNGYPVTYAVGTNESVGSIAAGLTAAINAPSVTNATLMRAFTHGDRIELQSLAEDPMASPFFVADSASPEGATYQVSSLPDSFPPRMIPIGLTPMGRFAMDVEMPSTMPYVIYAATNLTDWQPILTNSVPGLLRFEDIDSTNYSSRFYSVGGPNASQPPQLSHPLVDGVGAFRMQVTSVAGLPCAVEATTNFLDWEPVLTNQGGGTIEFVDPNAPDIGYRWYRAAVLPPPSPSYSTMTASNGTALVRIEGATRPFVVEVGTTNGGSWTPLLTNFNIGGIQLTADSQSGSASERSTFLRAAQTDFQASTAFGRRQFTVSGNPKAGAWIELTITKTNDQVVTVGVTNTTGTSSVQDLASELYDAINSHPDLQGGDGVVAEDFTSAVSSWFNLRARSAGLKAAAVSVFAMRGSSSLGLIISPAFVQLPLTENLSDLQYRNHLYVTAGRSSLNVSFPLNTTNLIDGWHELTAVAYEGSHVRTQTRRTIPVRIQNTPLSATLSALDLTNNAPVFGTYHIEVAANTNNVATITLYSTGGALDVLTNMSTATFEFSGTNLWGGLHPFYAVVETESGLRYRTKTHWFRLGDE